MQQNLQAQLQAMQMVQQQKQAQSSVLEQISQEVQAMSQREREALQRNQDYIAARNFYESGFLAFIGEKFGVEYASGSGKAAAEGVLEAIRKAKAAIQQEEADRERRIAELLDKEKELEELKKQISIPQNVTSHDRPRGAK